MKKRGPSYRRHNTAHAVKCNRRRLVSAEKLRRKRVAKLIYAQKGYVPDQFLPKYNLLAPENFNLNENFEEVVAFLNQLRSQSVLKRGIFSISFKTIQHLSPAAALLLTAEVDRWRRIKGAKLQARELDQWHPDIRRLLNEMGFFEALEMRNPCDTQDHIDGPTNFLPVISEQVSDGNYAKTLRQALEKYSGAIDSKIFLYNGLVEAMSNSVEHGYPSEARFHPAINRRWWMSGSFNRENGRITVMIYDHGVGIPTTLPKSRFAALINNLLRVGNLDPSDANLIRAAMEIGKTKTLLENRGLGLNEMREFVVRSERGLLRIISGKGEYNYSNDGVEKVKKHKIKLNGTLIAWEVYTQDVRTDADR